jgi:hypothetical protein
MYSATRREPYLHSAIYSAETLKDYYDDANIVIYTEERWRHIAEKADVFNNIVTDCPYDQRTKLYMLQHTPFDKTFYIDADTEIMHEDIKNIFNELPDTSDICITNIRDYSGAEVYLTKDKIESHKMIHHCGVFGFWNKPHILKFMKRWYEQYHFQKTELFKKENPKYLNSVRQWDQFAWWYLLNEEKHNININIMNVVARWNFVHNYKSDEIKSDIVIYHHTLVEEWMNEQIRN